MTTVYNVGDILYERGKEAAGPGRIRNAVHEWTVLSVVLDADYTDEEGRPLQVVTLRKFVGARAVYLADLAELIDIKANHGTWSREKPEGWK